MSLQTCLIKTVTCALPSSTVREVAEMMSLDDVGAVIIVENRTPVGIVTDRDIVIRCVCAGLDFQSTPIHKIMSRGVETVNLNDGFYDVAKKMKSAHVRRVVVVNEGGEAVGLLSFDDIFDLLTEEMNCLREAVAPSKAKIISQIEKEHAA